ncbi:MAG: YicC/YloC family endoribonuclease [Planctomycetota bacterium]
MSVSMTGFGRATLEDLVDTFEVEIRSVNNRYLSVKTRLPPLLTRFEKDLEDRLRKSVSRGSFDVYVKWRSRGRRYAPSFDVALADQYMKCIRDFASRHQLTDGISAATVMGLPGVLQAEEELSIGDEQSSKLGQCFTAALEKLVAMRTAEGERLDKELRKRLQIVSRLVAKVKKRQPRVVVEYEQKLRERLNALLAETNLLAADESLRREVALLADRVDVAEEIARLVSHLEQFESFLQKGEAIGRSLDFLVQEMGREINTIGSKAQDAEIARLVVDLKSELERVREQVQNIE